MAIENVGKVNASGGRSRDVQWDTKNVEVLVRTKSGMLSSGNMKRTGLRTDCRGDVFSIAQSWLESDRSR